MLCYIEYRNVKYPINCDAVINDDFTVGSTELSEDELLLIPGSVDSFRAAVRSKILDIVDERGRSGQYLDRKQVQSESKIYLDNQFAMFLAKTVEMDMYRRDGHYELAVLTGHVTEIPVGVPMKDEKQMYISPYFYGMPMLVKN